MGIPAPAGVSASGLPAQGDQANAVVSGVLTAIGPGKPFAFRGPMNLSLWASVNEALTTNNGSLNATVAAGGGIAAGDAINSVNVPPGTTWATFAGVAGTLALPILTLRGKLNVSELHIYDLPSTAGLLGAAVASPYLPAGVTVLEIVRAAVAPNNASPGVKGIVRISALPTSAPTSSDPVPFEFALTGNAVATGVDANATFTGASIIYTGSAQVERSFDGGATWLVCNIGGAGTLAQFNAGTPVAITFGEPEREVLYRINVTALTGGNVNYRISQTGGAAESLAIGPLTNG